MNKVIVFDKCKNNLISIQTTCIGELTTRQELTPLPQISWILIPRNTKRPTLIPSSLLTRYDRLLRSGGGIPSLMDCLSEGEKEREIVTRWELVACRFVPLQIVVVCHFCAIHDFGFSLQYIG